jgi:hypothetical protein
MLTPVKPNACGAIALGSVTCRIPPGFEQFSTVVDRWLTTTSGAFDCWRTSMLACSSPK